MRPRRLLAALAGAGLSLSAAGAQTPLVLDGDPSARLVWTRVFASPGDDWINDIVPLGDGRVLAVGFLGRVESGGDWRALAATLREDGAVLSAREYGAGGGIDAFWSVAQGGDGRLAFAGFTTRIGAGGIDAFALFTDAAGTVLSERAFGGGGYDRFTDLAPAGDGYLFLGHSQPAGEDRRRLFAVRTARDGTPLWERIVEGGDSISPLYIEAAADGGFVVAGGIGRGDDSDLLVMKLDGEGRELWRRTIGTPAADDVNHGLALLPNGDIVVVGYSRSWGARDNDILAVTLSPAGEVLRRELLGGADDDRPMLAKADARGRVWIVGSSRSAGAGGRDMIVARLGPDGAFEPGVLTLGAAGDDTGTAVDPQADGAILIAGYSDGLGGGGEDAVVARIAAPRWDRPHPAFRRRAIP